MTEVSVEHIPRPRTCDFLVRRSKTLRLTMFDDFEIKQELAYHRRHVTKVYGQSFDV